jgi:signal transduction histidine kinase/HD-GYP domain-containing protein (c-di-GMP phosphodiesterase class II)
MWSAELIVAAAAAGALVVETLRHRHTLKKECGTLRNAYDVVHQRNEQLMAAADEMGRLYRNQLLKSRKQSARLQKVLETASSINSDLSLDKVLHGIVHAVTDSVGFRLVLLRVWNDRKEAFEARAFAGLDRSAIEKLERHDVTRPEFEGWLREEFRVSRSYFISHKAKFWPEGDDEGYTPNLGERREGEWHQDDVLLVPLRMKDGTVVGYLSVDDPADRRVPSRDVIETVEILAAHAVAALQNATLYEQLAESMRQLEEATERAEELNDLKASFVSIVTHELKTPLTVILGNVEPLLDSVGGTNHEMQRDFLEGIHEQGLKLKRLIESILELSQIESGKFRMNREPVSIPDLVDEVLGLLKPMADPAHVLLEAEIGRRDTILECDRSLLRRVLLNLGNNAIKFMPEQGGRVTFRVQSEDRSVRIEVEDTGIGIRPEEITRVFDKFYQVDSRDDRLYPGVGLGLSVAKSIVEWHGGEIVVTSEPERGSRFTVRLPQQREDAEVITRATWTPGRTVLDHLTRLTVEMVAEVMNARIASLMLVDQERDELYIQAARGLREEVVCGTRVRMDDSIAGWVARHGTPLLVTNVEEDPRFGERRNAHQYETKSLLSVPVKIDGRVVGVININNKVSCTPFTEDDRMLLSSLSERVARAWQHATDHDETADRVEQTTNALSAIIENARRSRLKLTSGSMATRAVAVARRLGLSEHDVQALAYVASIHDVGMAHVGAPVLHEPGALDPDAWAQVAQHPARTVEIVKPIEFQEQVTEIIMAHHERLDGRGYPRGLRGDEIPLGARIIAVVDAYESMTMGRPYRQSMSHEDAVREIRRCAGTQFDPKVVEAFIQAAAAEEDTALVRTPEAA